MGVGDFYYELAVQVVECCMESRHLNGGFMELFDLVARLQKQRSTPSNGLNNGNNSQQQISEYLLRFNVIFDSLNHQFVIGTIYLGQLNA